MEGTLHLFVSQTGCQVDGPVTETEEELFGLFVAAIHPGIAQTGIHLMEIIKRYPCARIRTEVAFLIVRPDTV